MTRRFMTRAMASRAAACLAALAITLGGAFLWAEQYKAFGAYRVHYIAFNTTLLSPEIADHYDIVRGADKGLVNISIIDGEGKSHAVPIEGTLINLLEQRFPLAFREVKEDDAVYYLATYEFQHRETLRFEIVLDLPDHGTERFVFQQALHEDAGDGR